MSRFVVYTCAELCAKVEREQAELRERCKQGTQAWGRWRYNPAEPPSLDIGAYQIVLDRIDTIAKLGDWLMHMADKKWVAAEDLGNLVAAVRDLHYAEMHPVLGQG